MIISEDVGGIFNRSGPGYLLSINPHLRQVPQVGSREHPNLEALLNCKPDLILADTGRDAAIYPQLQKIAPTLMVNSLRVSYPEMEESFLTIAKAVNKSEKAQRILKEQHAMIQRAKAASNPKAGPLLVVNLFPDNEIKAFTNNSYIAKLFSMLGRPYALSAHQGEIVQTITLEGLLALNPDAIVVLLTDGNRQPLDHIQDAPLWQQLTAVQHQRIYIADRALWVQSPGVLSSREIIKQVLANGLLADKPTPLSQQSLPEASHWF
jgi:iron complex transport system substrate-binding protein